MLSIVASVFTICLFSSLASSFLAVASFFSCSILPLSDLISTSKSVKVLLYAATSIFKSSARYSHTCFLHRTFFVLRSLTISLFSLIFLLKPSISVPISMSKLSVSSKEAIDVGSLIFAAILCLLMVIASTRSCTFTSYSDKSNPGIAADTLPSSVATTESISDSYVL